MVVIASEAKQSQRLKNEIATATSSPRNDITALLLNTIGIKPLNYFEQIINMPNRADKFDLRLQMAKSALADGIKPTARRFHTTPKTARKWLQRYRQESLAGLNELPRIPLSCPHKTPTRIE